MHEFGICEGIVSAAVEALGRSTVKGRLKTTRIVVGRLHQVIPETLRFAYGILAQDTAAAGSVLEIREVPVAVACRACGWSGDIAMPLFRCGACQSGEVDVVRGRELFLESLEIESDDGDQHTSVS